MRIPIDTLPFLNELKKNNNREWFNDHKPRFVALQEALYEFIDVLIGEMSAIAPEYMGVEAKRCLFRIHKDARFAKGQEPYKTHFGIHIVASGHRADFERAGFYLHIEPEASMIGGGAHAPSSEWLKQIRREIVHNGAALELILANALFKQYFGEIEGDALKRPPQGYSIDSPHLGLLKQKALWVKHNVNDERLEGVKFSQYFAKVFEVYRPFQLFLNDLKTG